MFSVTVGRSVLSVHPDRLPEWYGRYAEEARLVEEFDHREPDATSCLLAVSHGPDRPFLVVALRYDPAGGFHPGTLLVAETGLLFIGAGERRLAYRLDGPTRFWEEATDCGLWGWARHEERVILWAELELAAWDVPGRKCWSMVVEPPWSYEVSAGMIELDVMGTRSSFPLDTGPTHPLR